MPQYLLFSWSSHPPNLSNWKFSSCQFPYFLSIFQLHKLLSQTLKLEYFSPVLTAILSYWGLPYTPPFKLISINPSYPNWSKFRKNQPNLLYHTSFIPTQNIFESKPSFNLKKTYIFPPYSYYSSNIIISHSKKVRIELIQPFWNSFWK